MKKFSLFIAAGVLFCVVAFSLIRYRFAALEMIGGAIAVFAILYTAYLFWKAVGNYKAIEEEEAKVESVAEAKEDEK